MFLYKTGGDASRRKVKREAETGYFTKIIFRVFTYLAAVKR